MYTSSQRLGCFLEALAQFRPDPAIIAAFGEIENAGDDDRIPFGIVPLSFIFSREIGRAHLSGEFVDVAVAETIGVLRIQAADICITHSIQDVDLSALCSSTPRAFTQAISRFIYERDHAGVRYLSKYGADIENWAVFEPFDRVIPHASDRISPKDEDLRQALEIHGLRLQHPNELPNFEHLRRAPRRRLLSDCT